MSRGLGKLTSLSSRGAERLCVLDPSLAVKESRSQRVPVRLLEGSPKKMNVPSESVLTRNDEAWANPNLKKSLTARPNGGSAWQYFVSGSARFVKKAPARLEARKSPKAYRNGGPEGRGAGPMSRCGPAVSACAWVSLPSSRGRSKRWRRINLHPARCEPVNCADKNRSTAESWRARACVTGRRGWRAATPQVLRMSRDHVRAHNRQTFVLFGRASRA